MLEAIGAAVLIIAPATVAGLVAKSAKAKAENYRNQMIAAHNTACVAAAQSDVLAQELTEVRSVLMAVIACDLHDRSMAPEDGGALSGVREMTVNNYYGEAEPIIQPLPEPQGFVGTLFPQGIQA